MRRRSTYGWADPQHARQTARRCFFIAVYIHMFRNLYYGSYKAAARSAVDPGLRDLPPDDGHGLHGLRAALGVR